MRSAETKFRTRYRSQRYPATAPQSASSTICSAPPSAPEPELDVDMGQLRRMMSALRGGGHDSANRHLLEAMKPYLSLIHI